MSSIPNPEGPDEDWYWWWYIYRHRRPPPPPPPWDELQRVINVEKIDDLNKYFEKGWTYTTQLKSGAVIITKTFSADQIAKTGIAQLRTQALRE